MSGIDNLIGDFLSKQGGSLTKELTSKLGFTSEAAGKFIPAAGQKIQSALQGGGLDISKLAGGDFSALLSMIDVPGLAKTAGVDAGKAKSGLETILGSVMQMLSSQSGGLQGLLKSVAGGSGGILGTAKKMLGGAG
jgi:hypothetical protein